MRALFIIVFFLVKTFLVESQVLIHSHNDYEKPQPLINALNNKAYSVEADVFPLDGKLCVAHTINEVDTGRTLESMYIVPLVSLFMKYHGYMSPDTTYKLVLLIDIKENHKLALENLVRILKPVLYYFDRDQNRNAVQIVISGERGEISEWIHYPPYILIDGRPEEEYDEPTRKRVAFVSENFWKYVNVSNQEKWDHLEAVVSKVHQSGKLVRFWATPDSEKIWARLRETGVDIINTDKVEACRKFFLR